MPTKYIRCPYCKRLTFIRYNDTPKWVRCWKVINPYFKSLSNRKEISGKELKNLPFRVNFRPGCFKKFMVNSNGEPIH